MSSAITRTPTCENIANYVNKCQATWFPSPTAHSLFIRSPPQQAFTTCSAFENDRPRSSLLHLFRTIRTKPLFRRRGVDQSDTWKVEPFVAAVTSDNVGSSFKPTHSTYWARECILIRWFHRFCCSIQVDFTTQFRRTMVGHNNFRLQRRQIRTNTWN